MVGLTSDTKREAKICQEHSDYYVRIDKEDEISGLPTELGTDFEQIILLTSCSLGEEEALGQRLMEILLSELSSSDVLPQSVVLLNSAVKLGCEDSAVLGSLLELERRSVRIFACIQSLEFYGLAGKLCVGTVIGLSSLVNYVTAANKVVTLG